jgi:protein O-GlcNAc transferase
MHIQLLSQCVNNAHAANSRGEYSVALELSQKAINMAKNSPEAWYNLGIALSGLGKRSRAMKAFEKTRIYALNSANAQNSIGLQLFELGAYHEAEQCFKRALSLMPDYVFALSNLGRLQGIQKRLEDAKASFRKAIDLQPDLALLYTNLGAILNNQNNHGEAEVVLRKSVELDAKSPETWSNLGGALYGLKRYEEAEAACRQAIELDAKSSEAWGNLGGALNGLKRYEEAEAACRQAIELDAKSPEAWGNLGGALNGLKRYEEAAECFGECLKLNADAKFLFGDLLYTKLRICDWRSLANDVSRIVKEINLGIGISNPFAVLGVTTDSAVQRKAAEIWVKDKYPEQTRLGNIPKRNRPDRIRIGYYSSDFHTHPVSIAIVEMLELHNREEFELIAFSLNAESKDEMQERVSAAVDRYIDVSSMNDREIAELSRSMMIDIAVDLNGHTQGDRTGIFAMRAAPIQVNYLGYPGTMGAEYIDYIIADRTTIPEEAISSYSEKIAFLPNCFFPSDRNRNISSCKFLRSEFELPEAGFVFCCFNNPSKISPATFDTWMRILHRVAGSVVWLASTNEAAKANLRKEAVARGINPERIVFAKIMPCMEDHLARHHLADLFLDTLPYNAHSTASDALWAGLPVLTCKGEAFASRVAASLLNAISLSELITSTQEEYETLAVKLATHPELLICIKEKLSQNKLTAPLFDTPLLAKHMEMLFAAMFEKYLSDVPPDYIYIGQ